MRYPIVVALIAAAFSFGLAQIPTDDFIEIQTPSGPVRVKNFYKTAVATAENEVLLHVGDGRYTTTCHRSDSLFTISFVFNPIDVMRKARKDAEAELLIMLGIDKVAACKLDVFVSMPPFNSNGADTVDLTNYRLTFCPNSKPLPGAPTSSRVTMNRRLGTSPSSIQTQRGPIASQECTGLLPSSLAAELGRAYPASSVVTLKGLEPEARSLFTKQLGHRCPGIVHLDFFGDHRDTYGVLLATNSSAPDSSNARLILASRVRPSAAWQVQTLEESGELGWMWIARDKPGVHKDVYGQKTIRAKGETLFFAAGETVAILYGWTGKNIDKIWLAD